MNIESLREYCISKKGATESFPFDEVTLVFKVMNKIFAMTNLDAELSLNVKCDPEKAITLRETYAFVRPGYHMSKIHWNTIDISDEVPDKLIIEWIDHSYSLIVKSLTRKQKEELKNY
ncbi:MAG TPA: MmcQ/YjbR family DNA-binding protein [Prolixibacteraceae bacterium]|nr:MmcQ/YjbR family DNA-binding protein [Prolixibacteraceae bacterium]